jgi:predicted NACHT family NTPase
MITFDHGIAKELAKDIVLFWHKVFTKWLTLTLCDFKIL